MGTPKSITAGRTDLNPAVLVPLTTGLGGTGQDDANTEPPAWLKFYSNPWQPMPPLTPRGNTEPEEDEDSALIERSRSSLRQWMDENPY